MYPVAQIPQDLLREKIREVSRGSQATFDLVQGELLGLGITRYARMGGNGRQVSGQFKRLCLAFPSGDLRTNISISKSTVYVQVLYRFDGTRLKAT